VSGLTQIPGSYVSPVADAAAAAPTWSMVPPSTTVESARPVEPVASAEFQATDLSGDVLANAMAFTAIAAMVRDANRDGEVTTPVESAPVEIEMPAERLVGNQVRQFQAALSESGQMALSEGQMLDALRSLQPQPNPQPTLPNNVERLASLVRGQILQDYRIAFMVHGRLTPEVAQLLF
jgi:hypothetical protein